mmetsp:Transcript_61/g.136  ORF Transcript_61/g.136 Transcript_61/m.136 type:complete len:277 (-) Transcript_61:952-1782(-)
MVPDKPDVFLLHRSVSEHLARPQLPPPDHDHDVLRRAGEDEGVLHGRVASSHDHHVHPPEEVAVAGGAGRHAGAPVLVLAGHVEPDGVGARGDDNRVRHDVRSGVEGDLDRPLGGVDCRDGAALEGGPELDGLGTHERHNVRACDVEEAGVVLDLDALPLQLATEGGGDDDGAEAGAASVDSGAETRGSGAHDHHAFGEIAWLVGGGGGGGFVVVVLLRLVGGLVLEGLAPGQLRKEIVLGYLGEGRIHRGIGGGSGRLGLPLLRLLLLLLLLLLL